MSATPCVLLVIPSMEGMGGTERVIHELSALLAEAGWTVHQASFDPRGTQRHYESATPLHALGPLPRLPLLARPATYARAARRLRALERALQVDVTISNLWGADLVSALAGSGARGPARVALAHINVRDNPDNRMMMRFLPLVAALYRRFDRVVGVSAPLGDELAALYALDPGRVTSIHNFVRLPSVEPPPWSSDDGVERVVWCGRMAPVKNVHGLLHAWARHVARAPAGARRQLVLVGDGPSRGDLERLADDLGLRRDSDPSNAAARVVFVGSVPHAAPYLASARGLVLASHAEGAPMVVLEALALGLPVLASDCPAGGVRAQLTDVTTTLLDGVEDTGCGVLLPIPGRDQAASLEAWASALDLLFDDVGRSPATWRAGAAARGERFGRARAGALWTDLVNSVLDTASTRAPAADPHR